MLERAVDELLGPNSMKWRDRPRYIQIRPIQKGAGRDKTVDLGPRRKGVARPVPKEIDEVIQVTAKDARSGTS